MSQPGQQFISLCGRIYRKTDASFFPRARYRDRTIYFCTEACLDAFLADPDRFYKVHRKPKRGKQPVRKDESCHVE